MEATELRGGRYVLLKPLGEGGQAETFEAVDKHASRIVAVKRFRVGHAKAWKDVELAEREALTLASLDHDLLPKYVEHFEEDGALVLVMERIEGESLAALRKKGFRASIGEVKRLLTDASRALSYLHGLAPPVVHRDLKPANVIRRPDGSYAFVDFGAVRDRLKPAGGSTVVGTFGYMAPEQFQGRASAASDVYGIGATALALLTGEEPEALPHKGLAIDVANAVPTQAPAWLVRTLEAMLDPDPDARASSIADAMSRGGPGAPPPIDIDIDTYPTLAHSRSVWWAIVHLFASMLRRATGVLRRAPAAEAEGKQRRRVADDVLRSVRAVSPEQAQREAIRAAELRGQGDAEAWADQRATKEAEQWEPPEAWVKAEAEAARRKSKLPR